MVLYYIQTWVVRKGLVAEHESLMEHRLKKLDELAGEGRVRFFHTAGALGTGGPSSSAWTTRGASWASTANPSETRTT